MRTHTTQWAPVLTSEAGATLTLLNWKEIGVHSVVYYLDSLLVKPGYSLLNQLPDFSVYCNWPGELIINASRIKANKDGVITIISPYDGRKVITNFQELIAILTRIKPRMAILPKGIIQAYPTIWEKWDNDIMPFLTPEDIAFKKPSCDFGVSLFMNHNDDEIKSSLENSGQKLCYVYGAFDRESMIKLNQNKVDFIESDIPADEAMKGLVYKGMEVIDIKNPVYAECHEVIDPLCSCPVCKNNLTVAYLHHLLAHTPLLCQRYLVQHNASCAMF